MDHKILKKHLDKLYATYDRSFLSSDPLWFVHEFTDDRDREIVGLIASSLAYGRVSTIKKSIARVLEAMGNDPFHFTMGFDPAKNKGEGAFPDFVHRFNTGRDVACLIYFVKQMITECGSIGGFFLKDYKTQDANIKNALASFSARALLLDSGGIYGTKELPEKAGVRFFFPSPETGSACKRLNLYLRWMVRTGDDLDLGIWTGVNPGKLIIPLDTHVARLSVLLGLTRRRSAAWPMAQEITEELKKLDPKDPVKYDFAISRLGILDECSRKPNPAKCTTCMVKEVCVIK